MESVVFIKKVGNDLTDSIRECFDAFGGVDSIVKGNVFIKINATMQDPTAITTPEVVLSTVKVVKEASFKPKNIYVMDNCAVGSFTRLVFEIDKLSKKIKRLGAKPLYLDEEKPINIDFKGKILDKPVPIPRILYENLVENKNENTYINLPKLKAHLQADATACIKNQHGLLYDREKIYRHQYIHKKVVDIMDVFKPDFNIVDATTVVDYGPVALTPECNIPMGLLLAGPDMVAVDTVCFELIGIENVRHIELAAERGLGCNELEAISIFPTKDLVDRYKIQLHSKGIPGSLPDGIIMIKGKKKACKTGCSSLGLFYFILTRGGKFSPSVNVFGKGHDIKELDKYQGPFLVNGPCAVAELKDYFDGRQERENIEIYYVNEHCDISQIASGIRKASKIPLSALSSMIPFSIFRMIVLIIIAKLHGVNYLQFT